MKRYLIRLTYVSGVSKGYSNYLAITAKTEESAVDKARKFIAQNYRHSMCPPCIDGVQPVNPDMAAELKADITNFQREIEEASLALNRAKITLSDLKRRLNALQGFTPDD